MPLYENAGNATERTRRDERSHVTTRCLALVVNAEIFMITSNVIPSVEHRVYAAII
jgi:hypothetical protein